MTADIFFLVAMYPVVFALIASFFSKKAEEDNEIDGNVYNKAIMEGLRIFFLVMTLIACFIAAAIVQNNWDTLIGGTQNMGNPLIDLAGWTLWIGLIFITLDLFIRTLLALFPKWVEKVKVKKGFLNQFIK